MKSALPPIEEIKKHNTMKMVRVKLSNLPSREVTFTIEGVNEESGEHFPIVVPLHEIDDHIARGYLPSKVWWRPEDDDVHFLFYVQESMPLETRPFGTGKSYIAAMYVSDSCTLEYEVGLRIFIDQVQTSNGTLYVFMFGEDEYKNVVVRQDHTDIPVDEECPLEHDEIFDLYKGIINDKHLQR